MGRRFLPQANPNFFVRRFPLQHCFPPSCIDPSSARTATLSLSAPYTDRIYNGYFDFFAFSPFFGRASFLSAFFPLDPVFCGMLN